MCLDEVLRASGLHVVAAAALSVEKEVDLFRLSRLRYSYIEFQRVLM